MTTTGDIEEFLALRRVALVGVSRNPEDFSRRLFRELCERGYDLVPVHPTAEEIENRECFPCLLAVKPPVEGVLVMTQSHQTLQVVKDCAETGIRRVWMYRAAGKGAVSAEAVDFCRANAIHVVEGYCPFLFLPGAAFPHRVHSVLMKLTRRYPARSA